MARQSGLILIEGKIRDLSFYKSNGSYWVRAKGGADKDRIKGDPAFCRTRENDLEFGRASTAGRLIKKAFVFLVQNASDDKLISRLTAGMLKVIRSDQTHVRGERIVDNGDLVLMRDFDFNNHTSLRSVLNIFYQAEINRKTGEAVVRIPEFIPQRCVRVPRGATHLQFVSGGAAIHFQEKVSKTAFAESGKIAIGWQTEKALCLVNALPEESHLPLFLVFGIQFYKESCGEFYPVSNGRFNALSMVAGDALG